MSRQVELQVRLELLSDTIFGSGHSIPGGEDIAVCQDENGYPYLKGTTFKGVLRGSMQDGLEWSGGPADTVEALLGKEDWTGTAGGRRLHLTPLTLEEKPEESETCYDHRTFTSLENDVVKTGTLRSAVCVRRGQTFTGRIFCEEQDVSLVRESARGIKWLGTMRSRGFGHVKVTAEPVKSQKTAFPAVGATRCLHYTLYTETPVSMTDYNRSGENSWDTHGYIAGAAVRGMAASLLAQREPDWFAANKIALLTEKTRFLSAFPVRNDNPAVLPSLKGFYEQKDGSDFRSVLENGEISEGSKRADVGSFCTIENGVLHYWNARTGGSQRIQRGADKTNIFQTRSIDAGQRFDGYILLDDASIAPKLAEVLCGTVWIGADRYDGMGKCRMSIEPCDAPAYRRYGSMQRHDDNKVLYMLALSPLSMANEYGEPCGINWKVLAEKLGIASVNSEFSSTSVSEYGGFNRQWGCHTPAVRMYDAGSLFKISFEGAAPDEAHLSVIEQSGLGLRRAEGFGQVLFLSESLFGSIKAKQPVEYTAAPRRKSAAELRRKRLTWIMEQCENKFAGGISDSQLGSIQAICEDSKRNKTETEVLQRLNSFFERNEGKGAQTAGKFAKIKQLVNAVLSYPSEPWMENMDTTERVQLLCDLFDHSRKEDAGHGNV